MIDPSEQADPSPAGALMGKMGMEFLESTPERIVARMPVEGNTQPFGFLHGGASAALAETVASFGGWMVDPSRLVMGLELKINHLRPVREGWLTATGVPVHLGKTTQLWEIRIVNDDGRLVAFATCTLAVRSATDE
ncbi:MAG: hotdog fold thioesterase [Actinomycetota bacterium]